MRFALRAWLAAALCLAALALTGCAAYTLRGKVIEGDVSFIAVVDADDPRFGGPGLSGAMLTLETDPERLNREVVGTTVSGGDGSFSIGVDSFGAGILMYDVGLRVERGGYTPAEQFFRLPSSSRRVLVMLAPGSGDGGGLREDNLDDLIRQFRR